MSRPRKFKKNETELLGDKEIYRLIKQHPEVKAYKGLTMEQIRSVFSAYRDIVYTATKDDRIRVNLPYLGQFFSSEEQGWKGGYVTFRKNIKDPSTEQRAYFPPKPNSLLLRFEFKKSLRDKFKEETLIPLTEKEIAELKEEAEKKEQERLRKNE